MNTQGSWINPNGFSLVPTHTVPWGKLWLIQHWEFMLAPGANGLAWDDGNGWLWRPDRHEAETDLGSIPAPLRSIMQSTEAARSYVFHDSAYRYAGLWRSQSLTGDWQFFQLDRQRADTMLRDMFVAEAILMGERPARARRRAAIVYHAVRLFAGGPWANHRSNDADRIGVGLSRR